MSKTDKIAIMIFLTYIALYIVLDIMEAVFGISV